LFGELAGAKKANSQSRKKRSGFERRFDTVDKARAFTNNAARVLNVGARRPDLRCPFFVALQIAQRFSCYVGVVIDGRSDFRLLLT
jgi:hypothetical protein